MDAKDETFLGMQEEDMGSGIVMNMSPWRKKQDQLALLGLDNSGLPVLLVFICKTLK